MISNIQSVECACGCGCGNLRPKYNSRGKELKFINGHNAAQKGKKLTEEHKKKIAESNKESHKGWRPSDKAIQTLVEYSKTRTGEKHHNWTDNPKTYALHNYVRRRLSKPELCMICKNVPPQELANITGIYERDLKNWAWFCIKCHREYDNNIPRMLIARKKHKRFNHA